MKSITVLAAAGVLVAAPRLIGAWAAFGANRRQPDHPLLERPRRRPRPARRAGAG